MEAASEVGRSPNRVTIRVGKRYFTLTLSLSQRERDRVRVHSWHDSARAMGFETASTPCLYLYGSPRATFFMAPRYQIEAAVKRF